MKTSFSRFFPRTWLAALCATVSLFAQEPPAKNEPPATPPPAASPAAPATPAVEPVTPPASPAAPATPAAAPAAETPAPAATAQPAPSPAAEKAALRRVDQEPVAPNAAPPRPHRRGNDMPLGDHFVSKGSRLQDAISLFGSTTVEGQVDGDAISVLGQTAVAPEARVRRSAVSVVGRLDSNGTIGENAVAVLGGMSIDGPVRGNAVCVFGNVDLGAKAAIDGDLIVIGGRLSKHPDAVVRGSEVKLPLLGPVGDIEWFSTWVKRCFFLGRPLAFGHHLGWAWVVALSFFAFYLLLSLLFSRGLAQCAQTLETRPGSTILASVLTVLLTPVTVALLAITVVGALLVPFLGAGLLTAGLFGKAAMLAWIGRRFVTRRSGAVGHPFFAVAIGGLVVTLLYTVPGFGFVLYQLLTWLGLGVVVRTIALAMKREKPVAMAASGAGSAVPLSSAAPVSPMPMTSSGFVGAPPEIPPGAAPGAGSAAVPSPMREAPLLQIGLAASPVAPAAIWPRATFFQRLAALALDGVLVGLLLAFTTGLLPRVLQFHGGPGGWFVALAIYGAAMWKLKGTTVGGIVCGLKVMRLDHRELDWTTAIVRALGCFLSFAVVGLGFIWIAFDDEKQSWHDKIAGTVVVRAPKGVSLV